MRFTSQTSRHHDGTLDHLTLDPVHQIQVGGSVGHVEARKQLGIGRTTGYRWRADTGGAGIRARTAVR